MQLADRLTSLDVVYVLTGIVLWIFAALTFGDRSHPRRLGTGAFWLVLGIIFVFGSVMPHWLTGVLVLLLVSLDGLKQVAASDATRSEATPAGSRIFLPVLLIPAVTLLTALAYRVANADMNRGALVGLGLGGVAAMLAVLRVTGGSARAMFDEGRKLNETMGAVNVLPQLLASLGVILAAAHVGDLIAAGIKQVIPPDQLFLLVLANCFGMALFTIVMGNSFAAFPVIATGVLSPLILKPLGVNPALAAIITLTAGSSGTLVTPMAANFNLVPAALLGMRDPYGVIKFQWPFALAVWSFHVVWLWLALRS